MSDQITLPDWVVVDGPAYLMKTGGFGVARLTAVTITKVTARDIVVKVPGGSMDHRFRKDRMTTDSFGRRKDRYFDHAQGRYNDPVLIGPEDSRVAEIENATRENDARSAAHTAVDAWIRDRSSTEKGRAVVDTFEAWLKIAEDV